ncbi:Uncharacterized protein APZ42_022955 [Daphnia magna]|uniref:Uncharacterized protein n=1 Tax=Daphnia magna TaxID=35525 RepID=A0A0P6CL40_9CRUS|nr:Uncharacterized protein APZ42_022955 [Daphnia magna]
MLDGVKSSPCDDSKKLFISTYSFQTPPMVIVGIVVYVATPKGICFESSLGRARWI